MNDRELPRLDTELNTGAFVDDPGREWSGVGIGEDKRTRFLLDCRDMNEEGACDESDTRGGPAGQVFWSPRVLRKI